MRSITMNLGERSYGITVGHGLLSEADKYFKLDRKVLIVTDSGVPKEYAETVASLAREATVVTVPEGEGSKSYETLALLHKRMLELGMTRTDCAVAVGGGVVGDLTGFAAATYMRGIDFYNVPTTLLSQVDSSIGGKCAINFGGVKNIIGAFHQPKAVIVDIDTLSTLPKRQVSNGLAESVKMALTSDAELFSLFEANAPIEDKLDEIIYRSLMIKKQVVETDERESGLRKILNFGHTFGHAVEAASEMSGLYHGECVAIGMCAVASDAVRKRLIPVLEALALPTSYEGDVMGACEFMSHDKKCESDTVSVVYVDKIGSYRLEKVPLSSFTKDIISYYKK